MQTLQIRVSPVTHRIVREIAERTKQPMQGVLEKAVEEYRRKLFFDDVNAAFLRLKADTAAWEEEQEERRVWEPTLLDGASDD